MNESKRILEIAGLINEGMGRITQHGDYDRALFSVDCKATDFATIKKKIKAGEELGLDVDIRDYHTGGSDTWEDAKGNIIFVSSLLLVLKGKKYWSGFDNPDKPEVVVPVGSTRIGLYFYQKR